MSNLPVVKSPIDLLPIQALPYVKAKIEGEPFVFPQSIEKVKEIILKGINFYGHYEQGAKADVIQFLAESTITLVLKDFKHLTVQELGLAVENGTKGNYEIKKNGLRTVNIENINLWIKSYIADESRKAAMGYYNLLLNQSTLKTEPTPEEKEKQLKKACIDAYVEFKHDGTITLISRIVYDYLKDKLKIEWSPEERIKIRAEATENYERELKLKKLGREITKNQFEAALENKKSLDNEMKKVALLYYFKKIKNNKQEIEF